MGSWLNVFAVHTENAILRTKILCGILKGANDVIQKEMCLLRSQLIMYTRNRKPSGKCCQIWCNALW